METSTLLYLMDLQSQGWTSSAIPSDLGEYTLRVGEPLDRVEEIIGGIAVAIGVSYHEALAITIQTLLQRYMMED